MSYNDYAMAQYTIAVAVIGWLAGLLTSHMARWAVRPKERER